MKRLQISISRSSSKTSTSNNHTHPQKRVSSSTSRNSSSSPSSASSPSDSSPSTVSSDTFKKNSVFDSQSPTTSKPKCNQTQSSNGNTNIDFSQLRITNNAKKKKGELIFKCNFESGNLQKVIVVNENEYELMIRPDSNNGVHKLWFFFSVSNVRRNQKVLFTICNFSKTRSLYRNGMTPLVRSENRPSWERIPEKFVYYYRSNKHSKNYVLTFLFSFDKEDDIYYFAYCYPYTYTDLQKFLHYLESKNLPYFKRELLCRTVQHRRCDLLTITDPQNMSTEMLKKKKVVVITARVHPGETPSSYVCHGFLSFIVSDNPSARALRDLIIFKVIPMLNPDGVFLGNYRCSSMGYDLNRQWLNPSKHAHPTIHSTRNLLFRLAKQVGHPVDFFIDIHAHSNAASGFMYMNHMNEKENQMLFPRLFDYKAKEFSFSDSKCCKDPSKLGTGRRALGEMLQIGKHCYTLEVSFFNYFDSQSKSVPLTEENYMELGRNMAITFLDFYSIQASQGAYPNSSIRKMMRNISKDSSNTYNATTNGSNTSN